MYTSFNNNALIFLAESTMDACRDNISIYINLQMQMEVSRQMVTACSLFNLFVVGWILSKKKNIYLKN